MTVIVYKGIACKKETYNLYNERILQCEYSFLHSRKLRELKVKTQKE